MELLSFTLIVMALYLLRRGGDRRSRIEAAWATTVGWLAMAVVAIHFYRECDRRDSSLRSPVTKTHQSEPNQISHAPAIPPGEWTLTTAGGNRISWSSSDGMRRQVGNRGFGIGTFGSGDSESAAVVTNGYLPFAIGSPGYDGRDRMRVWKPESTGPGIASAEPEF